MTTDPHYNVNKEPSLQCPHDLPEDLGHVDCKDPSHRIGCMYQTTHRVNVEICDEKFTNDRVIASMVTEAEGLRIAQEWVVAERAKVAR